MTALIVLKIIGWVLLGIIAVVTAALCIKVVVFAEYSDEKTELFLKWLFLKIPLYPAEKKEKTMDAAESADARTSDEKSATDAKDTAGKKNEPAAASDKNAQSDIENGESVQTAEDGEQAAPAQKKNDVNLLKLLYEAEGIDGLIEIVKRVFSYIGTFFGGLLRAFIIEEFDLDMRCSKKDAAKTAIYYGEVSSVLFPMLGALASACTLKDYNINVYPDFLARYGEASFRIKFHVVPIRLVGLTIALAIKLVFKVLLGLIVKITKTSKANSAPSEQKHIKQKNNNIRKSEVPNE